MAKSPISIARLGGVDSRSNVMTYPQGRALRCLNWRPMPDGHLELREGYTPIAMAPVVNLPVHSMSPFRTTDGHKYLVFWQVATPKLLDLTTDTVTSPVVKGKPIASSHRWSYYLANNRLHAVNGTDYKWFDGLAWRDIGIRPLTAAEAAAITITAVAAADSTKALPASSVGGAQPGYQFYASIYMPGAGEHVGNRVAIGARLNNLTPCDVQISGLPNLTAENPEYALLIGRTGDGAEVPYVVTDAAGNWTYDAPGITSAIIQAKTIDGNLELPTSNTLPPAGLQSVAWVGDRAYGLVKNEHSIYRTTSAGDNTSGDYLGRPEQSWPGTSETFPTAEFASAVTESSSDALCGTLNDSSLLSDPLGSGVGWQGPWNTGFSGQFAVSKGWKGLPYWNSGEKQLCTFGPQGPYPISLEYESALLAQIADAHLGDVEIVYGRAPGKHLNRLRIHFTGKDGLEHHVFHDFALHDASIDNQSYEAMYGGPLSTSSGEGYETIYGGPLALPHTICAVRDGNDRSRIYAGASNGQIYLLDSGTNDAGVEFTADYLTFLNFGDKRPLIGPFDYHGDDNTVWSICRDVSSADLLNQTNFETLEQQAYPANENNHHWMETINAGEMPHAFLRIQLTSHSADAPNGMDMNVPPHCPVETYGRILAIGLQIGDARG